MSLNMNAIRPLVERYKTATAGWQMQLALAVAEQSPALLARIDELTAELDRARSALGQIAGMCNCRAADDCPAATARRALDAGGGA